MHGERSRSKPVKRGKLGVRVPPRLSPAAEDGVHKAGRTGWSALRSPSCRARRHNPRDHKDMLHARAQHSVSPSDLSVLQALTGDRPPSSSAAHLIAAAGPQPSTSASRDAPRQAKRGDRRPPVDPLMIAAAASAGPQ